MTEVEPYTEQAADRLEHGVQNACGSLAIDVAEVRESIDDEDVKRTLKDAERALNEAGKLWVEEHQ